MSIRFGLLLVIILQSCDFRYGKDKIENPKFNSTTSQVVLAAIDNELNERPTDGALLKRKVRFLESAQWPAGSLATIDRAVKELPDDGELFYIKARFHLDKDELTPAIIALGQAGRLGYLTAEYFSVYAQVLLRSGEAEEALTQANRFKQLDPENYRTDFLQGKILYELGDTLQAIHAFGLAFDRQKHDDDLNLLLLDILLSKKDTEHFNEIVKSIEQNDGNWLLKLAMLKRSHGLLDDANSDLRTILNNDNDFMPAILYLSQSYYEKTYYDSARYYSSRAIGLDSLKLVARLTKARSFDKQYLYAEAIEEYQSLLAIDSAYQNAAQELNEVNRKVAYLRRLKEERDAVPQFDLGPTRKNTNSNN